MLGFYPLTIRRGERTDKMKPNDSADSGVLRVDDARFWRCPRGFRKHGGSGCGRLRHRRGRGKNTPRGGRIRVASTRSRVRLADATGNMEVGSPDAVAMLLYATGRIDSLFAAFHRDAGQPAWRTAHGSLFLSRNADEERRLPEPGRERDHYARRTKRGLCLSGCGCLCAAS